MSSPAPTQTATTSWNIDPVHSAAEFKVKHMMISNVRANLQASRASWLWTKPIQRTPMSRL